jgi:N-acetylneuraminic acid mutarotase
MSSVGAPYEYLERYLGVWTGSELIVVGLGYLRKAARYNPTTDTWAPVSLLGAPSDRYGSSVLWTGAEMIVWGGTFNSTPLNDGVRYNPSTDSWKPLNMQGTPTGRSDHSAVWTGSEMLIWGGQGVGGPLADGARYNPATDSWALLPSAPGVPGRAGHGAVWTGMEMIVWGGANSTSLRDGARYSPNSNSWRPMQSPLRLAPRIRPHVLWTGSGMLAWGASTADPNDVGIYFPASDSWTEYYQPSPLANHSAVWTGSQMLVWGSGVGFTYSLSSDTWAPFSDNGPLSQRTGHTAVWTGTEMIVWGGYQLDFAGRRINLGDGARFNPSTGLWALLPTGGAPSPRSGHSSVWTGTEMIVWGGDQGGARYNPATNSWAPLSSVDAPSGCGCTAVWAGNEMLVWGASNFGGRYNPVLDVWREISPSGAPAPSPDYLVVWTGAEMLVWNPVTSTPGVGAGGRYDPSGNVWRPMPITGGPTGVQRGSTAVWTGSEMIIWGPFYSESSFPTGGGARLNPSFNSWGTVATAGAPIARYTHSSVWTGNEMIIWGGNVYGPLTNSGGRYTPPSVPTATPTVTRTPTPTRTPLLVTATPMATADASGVPWQVSDQPPQVRGRAFSSMIWTGSEFLMWGGYFPGEGPTPIDTYFNDGIRYNPSTNRYSLLPTEGAPSPRAGQSALWTGSEMLIWGGVDADFYLTDGARFDPATNRWQPITQSGAPSARLDQTAVWTGSEMIVWGGSLYQTSLNTGARYDPRTDQWLPVPTVNAPTARTLHSAVWTGAEMLVWGGGAELPSPGAFSDGGRFNPSTGVWTAIPAAAGSSAARLRHTAVWTGSEMYIWGGLAFLNTQSGTFQVALNDGLRYDPISNAYVPVPGAATVTPRAYHAAAWTGMHLIIWGGFVGNGSSARYLADGARYDPATSTWTALSGLGAPDARALFATAWTGTELAIWAGENGISSFNDGSRYLPATDTWVRMASAPPPQTIPAPPYISPVSVWTGREVIVWAHEYCASCENPSIEVGARYSPSTNSWTALPRRGSGASDNQQIAVWTGTEMIVWGTDRQEYSFRPPVGGRYNPTTDRWTPISQLNIPTYRDNAVILWTGTEMIVWGETDSSRVNTGGRYRPSTDTWSTMSTTGAPVATNNMNQGIWTGSELIVWTHSAQESGRYNPSTDTWQPISQVGAPNPRRNASVLWTGAEMIVWGGLADGTTYHYLNDGARYNPETDTWLPMRLNGAPTARADHRAVWLGSEMLILGGENPFGVKQNTAARYNPSTDAWSAMISNELFATKPWVWTGTELLWRTTTPPEQIWRYRPLAQSPLTATITPSLTPPSSSTPTVTRTTTVTPTPQPQLRGAIDMPVRATAPNARLVVELSVMLTGTGSSTGSYQYGAVTNQFGRFTVAPVPTGSFDVRVKFAQSVSREVKGVTVAPGSQPQLEFGALTFGDANNDDRVSAGDFTELKTQFGVDTSCATVMPVATPCADFDASGRVTASDFTILKQSFGVTGPN